MAWGSTAWPYIPLETISVLVSLGKSICGYPCGAGILSEANVRWPALCLLVEKIEC